MGGAARRGGWRGAAAVLVAGALGAAPASAEPPRVEVRPAAPARAVSPAAATLAALPAVFELESVAGTAKASAGPITVQDMSPFGAGWGAGAQLLWRPPAPVNEPIRDWPHLTVYVPVAQAGTYRLVLAHTAAPDYGDVRVFVKGQPRADVVGYAPGVVRRTVELGTMALAAGKTQVVFTVFGKQAASTAHLVGLDRLELYRVK
jgi:hypothetical protein